MSIAVCLLAACGGKKNNQNPEEMNTLTNKEKAVALLKAIETGDTAGTVKDIGLFYTTLQTFDNRRVIIPNGSLSGGTITNYSSLPQRRVDLEFSAAYASDIDRVNGILLRVASSHPLTLEDPAPFARLLRQDSSALVFVLRVWCKTADYWTVRFDLNEQVKKAFDEAGVEIPFPQLDVHNR